MSISMFLYSQQAVNNALVLLQASYFEYALARIISFHVVYIVNRGHALRPSSAVSKVPWHSTQKFSFSVVTMRSPEMSKLQVLQI